MKIPTIFIPEKNFEKNIKRLLQGKTSLENQSIEITISRDDDVFKALE